MRPLRWAAIAIGIAGCFLVIVAVGGFIVRQLQPAATAPPVALASPTPLPSAGATAPGTATPGGQTAAAETPLPSAPPTPVSSPIDSGTPTATPTVLAPTAAPTSTPTIEPSSPPSSEPTSTPSGQPSVSPSALPTGVLDPPTAEEFATDLAAAISGGQNLYLLARLHPATIDRYGLAQCRTYIRDTISGTAVTWEVQGSAGPAPWDYVTDDLTTTIADAWAVTVRQPDANPEIRDLHFAPFEGTWRWFTDCGEPL